MLDHRLTRRQILAASANVVGAGALPSLLPRIYETPWQTADLSTAGHYMAGPESRR